MANYLLLTLAIMLAVSTASSRKCSSTSRYMEIHLVSVRNETGDWDISVDVERSITTQTKTGLNVDVKHSSKLCGEDETEHFTIATSLNHQQGRKPPTVTAKTIGSTTADDLSTTIKPTISTRAPHTAGYHLISGYGWYKLYEKRRIWAEARARCVEDGGDLLVIDSNQEREEMITKLPSLKGSTLWWVGAHDPGENGTWVTVHGKHVLSSWWGAGKPNVPTFICGAVDSHGLLYSSWCYNNLQCVCEIPE